MRIWPFSRGILKKTHALPPPPPPLNNIVEQYFDKLLEVEQFYHKSTKI